jgi:hypothetical protein
MKPLASFLAIVLLSSVVPDTRSASVVTRSGTWAYAERSYGPGYLAIPEGRGWYVIVCGPLGCLDRVSTDAGPELWLQKPPHSRIGDLAAVMFEEVCGPLSAGLCDGSYTVTGRADQHPEDPPEHPDDTRMRAEDFGPLPATDTEEQE